MKGHTVILILAAGKSSRLGEPKQLLPWGDTTLLGNAIKQALSVPDVTVYVVVGAYKERIQKEIEKYKVQQIYNPKWEQGIGSSIACGVKEIEASMSCERLVIALADQPFVTGNYLQELLENFQKEGAAIMATTYKDVAGVPVVFSKSYFYELQQLKGDKGAKSVIYKHKSVVKYCDVVSEFQDIDTVEAYHKLKKRWDAQENKKSSSNKK